MHQDVEQILVTEEELNKIAHRLAAQITKDYEGKKLLLIGVLKGSIYFFTDLSRYIDLPCNIDFIQASRLRHCFKRQYQYYQGCCR